MSERPRDFAADWVGTLLSAVEAHADEATRAAVFERCSRACTGYWAGVAREVRQAAGEGAGLGCLLAGFRRALPGGDAELAPAGDAVRWRFGGGACPCPVAGLAPHPALCECGTAHVRGMLEALLDRPLAVELVRSRLRGADDCLFVARPSKTLPAGADDR